MQKLSILLIILIFNVAHGQRPASYSEAKRKLGNAVKIFEQSTPHEEDYLYWKHADSLDMRLYQFLKFPQSYKYNFEDFKEVLYVTLLLDSNNSRIGSLRLIYFDVNDNQANGMTSRHGFVQWKRNNRYEVYRQDRVFKGVETAVIHSMDKLSDSTFLILSSNWTTQTAEVYRLKQNSFIKQGGFFPKLSDSETNSITNCVQYGPAEFASVMR